jgi:hypothetical protein
MRDDRSIKQTEIKNMARAQRVIGLGETQWWHKYFCRAIFWIYRIKQNQTKLGKRVNLTVNLRLWYHLMWTGVQIFWKVLITLDLVESQHNSIRLLNNSVLNPTIAAQRLLWLSTVDARSTSARRLSPLPANRRTQAKNKKDCNQIC